MLQSVKNYVTKECYIINHDFYRNSTNRMYITSSTQTSTRTYPHIHPQKHKYVHIYIYIYIYYVYLEKRKVWHM